MNGPDVDLRAPGPDRLPVPASACWRSEDANEILRIEALTGEGAIFLATHTPIEGFDVAGERAASVRTATEAGLLAALSQPDIRHAFCVVQGEPGSGKSHLIRWLYVQWPTQDEERDLPVLIRRADSSLEGSLRELRDRLPEAYRPLFDRIGVRQQATMTGRVADFVSNLANTLGPDYFETAPEDVGFCRSYDPAAILNLPEVRTEWKAPKRIVGLLAGADGERNSATATFDVYDVANLTRYHGAAQAVSRAAAGLLARIDRELAVIEGCETAGLSGAEALSTHGGDMPIARAFVDALNRRRNRAIQNSLGVSAQELRSVFLDLRRALKHDGRRLVLLLEDITAWEGLDDSLVDVLVTDARIQTSGTTVGGDGDGASDLCDLVSVVGLTPDYFRLLRSNYRQRITHEVQLGREQGGQLQDVASMREAENRLAFVARYLAATRAGKDALSRWGQDVRLHPGRPPPNVCADCRARLGCHAAFGHVDGVGLYPFSREAVARFYDALKPRDGNMTWRTPRGVIQAVLVPTLTRADALAERLYPVPDIEEHSGIDPDEGLLGGSADALLRRRANDEPTRERLRRLVAFWGDRHGSETSAAPNDTGGLAFAGVPRGVFDAFDLPWLGEDEPSRPSSEPQEPREADEGASLDPPRLPDNAGPLWTGTEPVEAPGTTPNEAPAPAPDSAATANTKPAGVSDRAGGREQDKREASPNPSPAPPRRLPPPREIADFLDDISQYRRALDKGAEAKARLPGTWNTQAYRLVQLVEPRQVGVDRYLFDRLFTTELVKIEGMGAIRKFHFGLKPETWLLDGLEAYIHLRNSSHLASRPAGEQEYYRRGIARCLARLQDLVRAHVERRIPSHAGGGRWEMSGALAEILTVRNWLRGVTSPLDPLDRQWVALLKDEPLPTTDPDTRVPAWKELVDKTGPRQGSLRAILKAMVSVPQGGSQEFGLADAGPAVRAVSALAAGWKIGPRPTENVEFHADNDLGAVHELLGSIHERLGRLPGSEESRLRERARRIEGQRRALGLKAHLDRLDKAIGEVSDTIPSVAVASVRAWRESLSALAKRVSLDEDLHAVEDALDRLLEAGATGDDAPTASEPSRRRADILAHVAGLPAARLATVADAFDLGERAVQDLLAHVQDFVGHEQGPGHDSGAARGLPAIQQQGRDVARAAGAALDAWEAPTA